MINVRIVVNDALGREIEILLNQILNPGTYEVNWDATKYSSGVYYYRIQTPGFGDSKKMILSK